MWGALLLFVAAIHAQDISSHGGVEPWRPMDEAEIGTPMEMILVEDRHASGQSRFIFTMICNALCKI